MKRKNYMFTNKKHSHQAIMAAILGMISNGALGMVIYLSYRAAGAIPASYGLTGFFAAVFSLIGLTLSIFALQDKEQFRLFPVLGLVLNLFALGILFVLIRMAF